MTSTLFNRGLVVWEGRGQKTTGSPSGDFPRLLIQAQITFPSPIILIQANPMPRILIQGPNSDPSPQDADPSPSMPIQNFRAKHPSLGAFFPTKIGAVSAKIGAVSKIGSTMTIRVRRNTEGIFLRNPPLYALIVLHIRPEGPLATTTQTARPAERFF